MRSGGPAVAGGRSWTTSLIGTTDAYFETSDWRLASGRRFEDDELRAGSAVRLVGATVRRELYGAGEALGQPLRVRQFSCTVVGTLAPKGQGAMGNDQDDVVILPLRTMQRRLTGDTLLVSMREGSDAERVKASLAQLPRERRKLAEGDDDDFSVLDTRQVADTLSGTTRVHDDAARRGGGGEPARRRHRHHGHHAGQRHRAHARVRRVRPAIGAPEREVLLQFLIEAVALAALRRARSASRWPPRRRSAWRG